MSPHCLQSKHNIRSIAHSYSGRPAHHSASGYFLSAYTADTSGDLEHQWILLDSPPTPTPEECLKMYEDGVDHGNGLLEYDRNSLPGAGTDWPGRWRRCVREFMEPKDVMTLKG